MMAVDEYQQMGWPTTTKAPFSYALSKLQNMHCAAFGLFFYCRYRFTRCRYCRSIIVMNQKYCWLMIVYLCVHLTMQQLSETRGF